MQIRSEEGCREQARGYNGSSVKMRPASGKKGLALTGEIMQKAYRMKDASSTAVFGEVARRYARTVLAVRKCKPATRTYYRSSLRMVQRIWAGLPGTPVQSITPKACRRWFDIRSMDVVASRANAELSMLKGVLDLAQREGLIAVNPAAAIAGHKLELSFHAFIPTREQFTRLVLIARGRSHRSTVEALLLFAYSGLRRHEAAG